MLISKKHYKELKNAQEEFNNKLENLEKSLKEVEIKLSKKYVSDNFKKEEKVMSFDEIIDEYLNGERKKGEDK